jgi:integrase
LPKWGERKIQDITKRDVIELLDGIVDAGRGLTANRILAAIRKMFNWSIERGIIDTSPCQGVKAPLAERARDRVLNDDEVRLLWHACMADSYPFGPLVQLLLLTGARRSEVAGMTYDEIEFAERLWTIPGKRTKNGEEQTVPLSDLAISVIEALPRITPKLGAPNYLFTTNAETHVSGYSRSKARLDALMREETEIPRWTLHDLRRTVASGLARLGIALPVIEKVLNHTSGSFAGVVSVYLRHSYAEEKRHALDAWAGHVELVTSGQTAKVVELKAAK